MVFEKEIIKFWEGLMGLIDKWGWKKIISSIGLVAVAVFMIVSAYNLAQSVSFDKQKEVISQIMTENDEQKTQSHKEQMEIRESIKPYITGLLKEIINDMNADRTFVIELHNGSNNISGLPFLHCTMTYEQDAKNIDPIDEDYQNLTLSRFDFPDYLHNHDLWYGTIDDFSEIDPKISARMKLNNATYMVIATIRSENEEIGYFGFTYCNGKQPKDEDDMLEKVVYAVQKLSKWLDKDINNV